jgi:hypothetical protein
MPWKETKLTDREDIIMEYNKRRNHINLSSLLMPKICSRNSSSWNYLIYPSNLNVSANTADEKKIKKNHRRCKGKMIMMSDDKRKEGGWILLNSEF